LLDSSFLTQAGALLGRVSRMTNKKTLHNVQA
jgi:hypothetical protein